MDQWSYEIVISRAGPNFGNAASSPTSGAFSITAYYHIFAFEAIWVVIEIDSPFAFVTQKEFITFMQFIADHALRWINKTHDAVEDMLRTLAEFGKLILHSEFSDMDMKLN
jgi:hypothetical protein